MQRIKLSPSTLEAFRKGRLFDNPPDEIAQLWTGEFKGNEHTSRGSAYHAIIEHGEGVGRWEDGHLHVFEHDLGVEWIFTPEAVQAALQFRERYKMVHEVKGSLTFEAGGYEVFCPFRVDGVHGLLIHEVKTKVGQTPDYETYMDSLQWRLYLEGFKDAIGVIYTVFELKLSKKNENLVDIKDVHQFVFYREPNLLWAVQNEVYELLNFCAVHGLLNYLQTEQT